MAFLVKRTAGAERELDAIQGWPTAEEAGETGLCWFEHLTGNKPHVYRILFTIDKDVVTIRAIRHGKRLSWIRARRS